MWGTRDNFYHVCCLPVNGTGSPDRQMCQSEDYAAGCNREPCKYNYNQIKEMVSIEKSVILYLWSYLEERV